LFHGVVRHVLPDPHAEQRRLGPNRGLTYWEDGADQRIFFAGGHRLVALDARSGHPAAGFGVQGVVDLTTGLSRPFRGAAYAVSSPGVIYKDVLVLGSMMSEGPEPVPSGEVRAFDVRSGRQRWSFHTVPLKGQAGSETWPAGAAQTVGGANAWAGMVADEARGLIFIPTGSAAFDYFGGDRTGANLFSDSLVAVRGETGQVVWHYQMVHHDLWDYDLPCPPALATVVRGQERVDVVVQATKQGLLFILNRDTGESLFPIEERTVPRSSVPGEQAWATQPFPLAPKPLSRLSITEDGLTDLSPRAHADALKAFRESAGSAIFLPPGLRGTIVIPGFQGGANWGGVSLDPRNGRLLINTNDIPYLLRLVPARKTDAFPYTVANFDNPFVDSEGYPAVKPPWGKLSAVNLNSGEIEWQVPLGEYKELTKRGIPVTGSDNIGGSLLTQSGLAFIGATKDRAFRAFDSDTGRVLWETTLPAAAHATPATYAVNGKQFVVIAAGGGSIAGSSPSGDEYISFSLPN
jgi:quinoprotein glucose dehydrogenase